MLFCARRINPYLTKIVSVCANQIKSNQIKAMCGKFSVKIKSIWEYNLIQEDAKNAIQLTRTIMLIKQKCNLYYLCVSRFFSFLGFCFFVLFHMSCDIVFDQIYKKKSEQDTISLILIFTRSARSSIYKLKMKCFRKMCKVNFPKQTSWNWLVLSQVFTRR